jgi:deoxyribonucleoside regulator
LRDVPENYRSAVAVAKMYYYQGLTTEQIADELRISRPTISRLLSFAREKGIVEVTVYDSDEHLNPLQEEIAEIFGISKVHIVPVPEISGEQVWLQRVAQYAANYLNSLLKDNEILGLAWGTTLSTVSRYLVPKTLKGVDIVQLNGSGNTITINNTYASEIIMRFADNYSARAHLFPVPTFFDYEETKRSMWRERSVQRILLMQQNADILLYSLGAVDAGMPSHVYSDGYLEERDFRELKAKKVVADLATVFFSEDGSYQGISLNSRSSGPDLKLYRKVRNAICVVSGRPKVAALHSALAAGLMNDLIVDEPTARLLLKREKEKKLTEVIRRPKARRKAAAD